MKQCKCGNDLKNGMSHKILGTDFIDNVNREYHKEKVVCDECKTDLLYANIFSEKDFKLLTKDDKKSMVK